MKKIIIAFSVLALFSVVALYFYKVGFVNEFIKINTETIVTEGAVEVWGIDRYGRRVVLSEKGRPLDLTSNAEGVFVDEFGKRVSSKILHPGERFSVESQQLKKMGSFFSDQLKPLMLSETVNSVAALRDLAKDSPDDFGRFYSEKELNDRILKKIDDRLPLISDLSMVVSPKGLKVYGALRLMSFRLNGSCSAILQVDEGGEPTLRLNWIRLGFYMLPKFMLRSMEDVFRESIHRAPLPMTILKAEYRENGIYLACKKNTGFLSRGL